MTRNDELKLCALMRSHIGEWSDSLARLAPLFIGEYLSIGHAIDYQAMFWRTPHDYAFSNDEAALSVFLFLEVVESDCSWRCFR